MVVLCDDGVVCDGAVCDSAVHGSAMHHGVACGDAVHNTTITQHHHTAPPHKAPSCTAVRRCVEWCAGGQQGSMQRRMGQ